MVEPKRTRPAAVWTGAGALLTGVVWASTQLLGSPAQARSVDAGEVAELRTEMRELTKKIDDLNTRLSHIEGAQSVQAPPVRSSSVGH